MIKAENISYTYDDGTKALKNISFNINKGDTVAIIGGNGAGKSTLLKNIMGILLYKEGSLLIDNEKITKNNLKNLRKKVGMVFQNPDDMLFMYTVYDDVAFGLRNNGEKEEEVERKVNNIAKYLDIENLLFKHSSKLSGGQKRKVALAAVLVMEPEILIFDEPTSFLDPKGRFTFIDIINKLEKTKIIATHDLDLVKETCSKTIILKDGELIKMGKSQDLLNDKTLMKRCDLYMD